MAIVVQFILHSPFVGYQQTFLSSISTQYDTRNTKGLGIQMLYLSSEQAVASTTSRLVGEDSRMGTTVNQNIGCGTAF